MTTVSYTTPGVYIQEIPAFGSSIVGVATAVPVFIGYTEFAGDPNTGKPLYNVPVQISSMVEFAQYFGGAAPANYTVAVAANPAPPSGSASASTAAAATPVAFYAYSNGAASSSSTSSAAASPTLQGYTLTSNALPSEPNQFNLYWSMQAFFNNGGGSCYVVSVGSYWEGEQPTAAPSSPVPAGWILGTISATDLLTGLTNAGMVTGPTMTVIPEACQLASYAGGAVTDNGYASVVEAMLNQAATLQDRVAIFDLPGCLTAATYDAMTTCQSAFWTDIAPAVANVSYGAAYGPALITSVVTPSNILYTNLNGADNEVVNNILTTQANSLYGTTAATLTVIQGAIATAFPVTGVTANDAQYSGDPSPYSGTLGASGWQNSSQQQQTLDNYLLAALPIFTQIEQMIANSMNILPPSPLMAGVWTTSDNQNGVWNAPANIALASVTAPLCIMNDAQQSGFNVPTNGESICIIRAQLNRGNVVWGARTLDGNSNDYRYIQVRRTLIYIEQSIKTALQSYVFAANDATTWSAVTSSISSFLTGLWQQGGLVGSKPGNAFIVQCGLGTTMTSQDILNGMMIVSVSVSMVYPAEFIVLQITQMMNS